MPIHPSPQAARRIPWVLLAVTLFAPAAMAFTVALWPDSDSMPATPASAESFQHLKTAYSPAYGVSKGDDYSRFLARKSENAANPALLHHQWGTQDPVTAGLPRPDIALPALKDARVEKALAQANANRRTLVVQFDRTPGLAERAALTAQHARILGYLPSNAFAVAVDMPVFTKAAVLHARFVGALPPAAKISPNLATVMGDTTKSSDMIPVRVTTYSGDAASPIPDLLALLDIPVEVLHATDQEGGSVAMLMAPRNGLAPVVSLLARLETVAWLEYAPLPRPLNSGSVWLLQCGSAYLRTTPLFDEGVTGAGQIYAAADSGLDTDACQFRYDDEAASQTRENTTRPPATLITDPENKVISYYTLPGAAAYDDAAGGFHGTMTTGCATGDNFAHLAGPDDAGLDDADGMAPGAKVVFQDVGAWDGSLAGLYYTSQQSMHKQAINSGASVHNDSYGIDAEQAPGMDFNRYDGDSRQIDYMTWSNDHYLVVFASGNSGPSTGTLGGEGSTAKSTLVAGASFPGWASSSDGDDSLSFSSQGPTTDGRLKPDILTPGVVISPTENDCTELPDITDPYGNPACLSITDPGNNQCYAGFTAGTSFSSPLAAGMALLARQYFADGYYPGGSANAANGFEPSAALVKAVLINSSRLMKGDVLSINYNGSADHLYPLDPRPSTMQGWGRIALDDALFFAGDRRDLKVLADIRNDSADGMANGEVRTYTFNLLSDAEPLHITLAWSDPPPLAGAGAVLVNDLDLEVQGPDDHRYLGNMDMVGGFSTPSPENRSHDHLNPVENVFVEKPQAGKWTVVVTGHAVPGIDEVLNPGPRPLQGFALVVVGDLMGQPMQEALVRFVAARFKGGCDDDEYLDLTETGVVSVSIGNAGKGVSEPVTVSLSVAADSPLGAGLVDFPEGGSATTGTIPGKSGLNLLIPLHLKQEAGAGVCGQVLTLDMEITCGQAVVYRSTLDIGLHQDVNRRGEPRCQEELCDPRPVITELSPGEVVQGQTLTQVGVKGAYFPEHMAVRFTHEGIVAKGVKLRLADLATLDTLTVAPTVPPGVYGLMLLDTAQNLGQWEMYPGLLTVIAADADGDADAADALEDDPEPADDTPAEQPEEAAETTEPEAEAHEPLVFHREDGCTGGPGGPAGLLLLLAALAIRAKRRRSQPVMR